MSYIAKIYLKKMFKKDSFQIDGDYIKITVNNVINPMECESVPEDSPNDHFEFIDENGNVVAGKGNEKAWETFKLEVHGKTYDKDNYHDLVGVSLDRGEQYIVYFPNPGWSSGEEHALTVKLYQDRPIEFTIKRIIQ
ncbi:MAG: hypothetical protein ACFFCS_06915 [Candidatus Hodarchaeota archaeon]